MAAPRWQRQLETLKYGEAPERAMIMRWFRRADVSLLDPLVHLLFREEATWVALYELDAEAGSRATLVFPVSEAEHLERTAQEVLVLVRGTTEPGDAVVVITTTGELEPAARPRRPKAADPRLVGEL